MRKLSIIIPYYNHGNVLQAAAQSALGCYDGPLEIIIVNDGSPERNARTFLRLAQQLSSRVKIINKENGGLSSARNAGIRAAEGDFIQFLDSDDVLIRNKVSRQMGRFAEDDDLVCSVTNYYTSDEWMVALESRFDSIWPHRGDVESFLFSWERGFSIPIHSAVFRRKVFERVEFDEDVLGKEDWIFWCNVVRYWPDGITYCPFRGCVYRLHQNSMTRKMDEMGESWVLASQKIQALWGAEYPDFESESAAWHRRFYGGARLERGWFKQKKSAGAGVVFEPAPSRTLCEIYAPPRLQSLPSAPLFSVIIPVHNHLKFLPECIDSLRNQSYKDFEVIIIDDNSTEIGVREYLDNVEIDNIVITKVFNDNNLGISVSQNIAALRARGKYLAFLDCDDYLDVAAFAAVAGRIESGEYDYYFTDRLDIDASGALLRRADYGGYNWISPSSDVKRDLLLGMVASHLKVIRKQAYLRAGGCRPKYAGIQDWDLALRIAEWGTFQYIPEALYYHRIHDSSVTSSASVGQFWLTNKRRRQAIETRTKPNSSGAAVGEKRFLTLKPVAEFDHAYRLLECKLAGDTIVLDAGAMTLGIAEINFLREFNSFFDRILVNDEIAASLCGYLWDEAIIATPPAP